MPTSDYSEDIDYGHGRIEKRKCTIISDLSVIKNADKWTGFVSIIKIEHERYFKVKTKKENEASYYVVEREKGNMDALMVWILTIRC